MASIGKMSIRGIRSFSPDREETIEFYSPLTMIVGANGCGKTSIIEALKYCCTGSLPPNAKNGHAFINDPTITESTEVKASIKLRFRNKRGQDAVVVRSLQVLRRKTKLEYKALEGVIRMKSDSGETVSLSHKCSELDKHIPDLLGVSGAVMENVIFCHQEESSWPLAECAVLKKKFDDIFESTRYAKALEVIAKTKKDYASKVKDLKCDVVELSTLLSTHSDDLRRKEACLERKEQCDGELGRIEEELQRLADKMDRANEVVRRSQTGSEELQGAEWQMKSLEIRVNEKGTALEVVLSDPDEVLESQMTNYERVVADRGRELSLMEAQSEVDNGELVRLRERVNELSSRRGEVRSLQAQLEDARQRHQTLSGSIARKHSLPVHANSWEQHRSKEYQAALQEHLRELQTEQKSSLSSARNSCSEKEAQLLSAKEAQQRQSLDSQAVEKELSRVVSEKEVCRADLLRLHGARDDLKRAELAYEDAQRAVNDAGAVDGRKMAAELSEITRSIRTLTESIAADTDLLQAHAKIKEEGERLSLALQQCEADRQTCIGEIESVIQRHSGLLGQLGVLVVPQSLEETEHTQEKINESLKTSRDELKAQRQVLKSLNGDVGKLLQNKEQLVVQRSQLDTKAKQYAEARKNLAKLLPELNDIRVYFAPDSKEEISADLSMAEIMIRTDEVVEAGRQVVHTIESAKMTFERFEKARVKANNACPCCKRAMGQKDEEAYHEQLAKLLRKKYFDDQEISESKSARALQISNTLRELSVILEGDDIALAQRLFDEQEKEVDEKAQRIRTAEDQCAQNLRFVEERVQQLERIIAEIGALCKRFGDISARSLDLRSRSVKQSQSIGLDLDGRTYAAIEQSVKESMAERDELQLRKDQLQIEETKALKRQYQLRAALSEAEKNLREASIADERHKTLTSKSQELDALYTQLNSERISLVARASSLQADTKLAERALADSKEELQRLEQDWTLRLGVAQHEVDDFTRLSGEVDELTTKMAAINPDVIEREIFAVNEKIVEKEEKLRTLNANIANLSQSMIGEDRNNKVIRDNLDFRRSERELKILRERVLSLKAKLEPDHRKLEEATRELQRSSQEKLRLCTEEATLRGRLKEVQLQVTEIESKLNSPTFRNISERHRRKNIEFETAQMTVTDLDSYYSALDSALATYHLMKIKEINKIIRELWQQVYRGDDIDRIEICSDQDLDTSGGTSKRSYNYRVVMTKGSIPLDMRGRCSAGQRVLAALVIRLALAETFCLSCGMLALDEPTTNLDDHNRSGLAHALARIISNRSKQQNFQLVCITHDETFVRLLSNELSLLTNFSLPEHYFRVSRKEDDPGSGKYFSCIERIDWDDM